MKKILLWDPRFRDRAPARLTLADDVASALVRSGVAAAADPAEQGALSAGPALDGGSLVEIVLTHGLLGGGARRVVVPLSAAQVAFASGLAGPIGAPIASGGGTTPVLPPVFASASSKVRIPFTTVTVPSLFLDSRIADICPIDCDGFYPVFGHEFLDSSLATTQPYGAMVEYWHRSLFGGSASSLLDQSGATTAKTTFNGAKADATFTGPDGNPMAYIWQTVNGVKVPKTYAELSAAVAAITGAVGTEALDTTTASTDQGMQVPYGWHVIGDLVAVPNTAAGTTYVQQTKARVIDTGRQLASVASGGTLTKNGGTTFGGGAFTALNWTGQSGLSTNGEAGGPFAVIAVSKTGKKAVMLLGDSIGAGSPGDALGGAAGFSGYAFRANGMLHTALASQMISHFREAVPSTSVSQLNAQRPPLYRWLLRFCGGLVNEHGKNNSTVSNFQQTHVDARADMPAGSKIIAWTPLPWQAGGFNSGSLTASSIASSGTTATVTTSAAHGLATGDYVQVGAATVAGYAGVVPVTVASTTSFTYTLPNGGTDLASASGLVAKGQDWSALSALRTWELGTGSGQGQNKATTGYVDGAVDVSLYDERIVPVANRVFFPYLEASQEGTHPQGASSLKTDGYVTRVGIAAGPALKAALGSGF